MAFHVKAATDIGFDLRFYVYRVLKIIQIVERIVTINSNTSLYNILVMLNIRYNCKNPWVYLNLYHSMRS